jgi:hypothetical protein
MLDSQHPAGQTAEALLAGLLGLMSAPGARQCPLAARRIAQNMAALATLPGFSPTFRRVCERLVEQWSNPQPPHGALPPAGAFHRDLH